MKSIKQYFLEVLFVFQFFYKIKFVIFFHEFWFWRALGSETIKIRFNSSDLQLF